MVKNDEDNVVKKVLGMDGYKSRGYPKKCWMVFVNDDIVRKEVTDEMAREVWRK